MVDPVGMAISKERVVFMTDRYRIVGVIYLPGDGYGNRMTDYINATERHFISLTDVEIEPVDGHGPAIRRNFLALSRQHVILAMPADEPSLPLSEFTRGVSTV